ncbi:ABC transporter related protein [Kribbella flavida DSM 17836]|uniref:ABC transporter related protein n=1 Tax=Kribbella flavida (strain DSM 17836 / JCM 10339 / NBRC 14399) TaxID=479435 RepID=D2PW80_KRIFD|nr:metal ABC transporter ATP-binding protein [Kribbella flavida]ADB31532.1 ABC transporter related protein [Kribbella flavida DSM 17836]
MTSPDPSTVRGPERAAGGAAVPKAVQVADLSVDLGGRLVLRGIDLQIRPGEVVAVLGANGSGKSTLVRTIVGLLPAARGEVRLFGTPVPRFRQWSRIGYVPQRITAAGGVPATVAEVVTSGLLSKRRWFRPLTAAGRAAVDRSLELVDMADRRKDAVAELSGGQQQRVLIARALVSDPELLVLDEPTAGVDLASQDIFADAIRERVARGTTVIMVSHDLGPMDALIDRSIVLRRGRIVYDGPPHASQTHAHVHPHPVEDEPGWLT